MMWLRWCGNGTANSASKALCPLPMPSALSRSAVPVSSSPTMAAGSWTAQGHHSTNWPKSSMPWETGVDVLMDGGVQRGTHVLKALSVGAKAVGIGRYYLYPLAAAGQAGVERALGLMQTEIERDMKLMGCTAFSELSRDNLRFR